jgi:hypothetical protein
MVELPETLKNKANARLNSIWLGLIAKQDAFHTLHGRYFQGIRTHRITPKDGDESEADLTRKPTDQVEDWNDFGIAADLPVDKRIEVALIIDVYIGPLGSGWQGRIEVAATVGGEERFFARQKGVGPEGSDRTFGWVNIIDVD